MKWPKRGVFLSGHLCSDLEYDCGGSYPPFFPVALDKPVYPALGPLAAGEGPRAAHRRGNDPAGGDGEHASLGLPPLPGPPHPLLHPPPPPGLPGPAHSGRPPVQAHGGQSPRTRAGIGELQTEPRIKAAFQEV